MWAPRNHPWPLTWSFRHGTLPRRGWRATSLVSEPEHLVDPVAFALFEPRPEALVGLVEVSEVLREEKSPTLVQRTARSQCVVDEGADHS